ncbi:MAG: 50S ribosomal protein L11 methyltransferase [Rikenellaceae bacterium]
MNYIEYSFKVGEPQGEILVAFLSDMGFESFVYEDGVQLCYITEAQRELYSNDIDLFLAEYEYSLREIEPQNWNTEWEESFSPIVIDHRLCVRAPFHSKSECEREIVIDPNMSFGTGHHPTTYMMLSELLGMDLQGRRVMDVGCGSGVLSILSAMDGASEVVGIEIDEWAAQSAQNNVVQSGYNQSIEIITGEVFDYKGKGFDVVVANINRNILFSQMEHYSSLLGSGGVLLCSGFYTGEDSEILIARALEFSLTPVLEREREGWALLHLVKGTYKN